MLVDIDIYGEENPLTYFNILEGREAFKNGLIAFIVRKAGDILYDPTIPSHNQVLFKLKSGDSIRKFGELLYDEIERFFKNYLYIENIEITNLGSNRIGINIYYSLLNPYEIDKKITDQTSDKISFEIKIPVYDVSKYEEIEYDVNNIFEFLDSISEYAKNVFVIDDQVFIDNKMIKGLKPYSAEYIAMVSYLQSKNPNIKVQI